MQMFLEPDQFLALAFLQSRDRNVRPTRNDFGDIFLRHFFAKQPVAAFLDLLFDGAQFFLQLRDAAVLQLARLREFAAALCALEFGPRLIEFFLKLALFVDDGLLLLPFRLQRR